MKAYLMLLKDNDLDEYPAVSKSKIIDGHHLYAITDNKEYYNTFISTRDMDKFIVKTIKFESADDYDEFVTKYSLDQFELSINEFVTTAEYNGYYTVDYVDVCCTDRENDSVAYDSDSILLDAIENLIMNITNILEHMSLTHNIDRDYLHHTIKTFMQLFNEDIYNALSYLDFDIYMDQCIYQIDNIDFSEYDLWEDKLKIYCKLYSNTYKKEFIS